MYKRNPKAIITILLTISTFLLNAQEYILKSRFTDELELPSNYISSSVCDHYGVFWFTCGGNLMSYDGIRFKRYSYNFGDDSSDDNKVETIYKNTSGEIEFFDNKNHYKIVDNQKIVIQRNHSKATHFSMNINVEDFTNFTLPFEFSLAKYQLLNLIRNKRSGYLISERFISYYNHRTKRIEKRVPTNSITYPSGFIYHKNYLTLFYKPGNLELQNGKATRTNIPMMLNGKILKNPMVHRVFESAGRYLLWMQRAGIFEVVKWGDTIHVNKIINGSELPDDEITSVQMMDKNDALLIACRSKGLYQYTKPSFKGFKHTLATHASINSILKIRNDIYLNNGTKWDLQKVQSTDGRIHFKHYGSDYIEDKAHQKRYFFIHNTIVDITDARAYPQPHHDLFYCSGTSYQNKVYGWNQSSFFVMENKSIKLLNFKFHATGAFNVHSIAIHKDTMWVGTIDGAYAYRLGTEKTVYSNLFKGTSVRSIMIDPHQRGILFFTYGNGVYLYINGKFQAASSKLNENFNYTHYMFIDNANRVWLATNKGMYCTDYEQWFQSFLQPDHTPYFYQFSKYDGLLSNELNGGTAHSLIYDSSSGIAYLSSVAGLISFNPNKIKINFPNQPIHIEETAIDDSVVYNLTHISGPFGNVRFKVGSAYYGNKENLRLEYRISNQSPVWRTVNQQNEFYLNRGKPGLQTIEVRFRNGFKPDQYKTSTFHFHIDALWYERTSYQILIILTILVLLWLIVRTRVQIQKNKQIQLKKIIDEQTRNIRKTLEDLTLSEDNLRTADTIKEKLIRVMAHDIRSPMISTIYLSTHIRKQLQAAAKPDIAESIHLLDNVIESQNNILNYANDFLAWYNVSHNFVKPSIRDVNLHDAIQQVLSMYCPIIEMSNNKLNYTADKKLFIRTDATFLSIIIRNLIDNANKNTRSGAVEIRLMENDGHLDLIICNDAKYCDPLSLEKMKNKLNSTSEDETLQPKLGLLLIKSLSKYLDLPIACNTDNNIVTVSLRFNDYWQANQD